MANVQCHTCAALLASLLYMCRRNSIRKANHINNSVTTRKYTQTSFCYFACKCLPIFLYCAGLDALREVRMSPSLEHIIPTCASEWVGSYIFCFLEYVVLCTWGERIRLYSFAYAWPADPATNVQPRGQRREWNKQGTARAWILPIHRSALALVFYILYGFQSSPHWPDKPKQSWVSQARIENISEWGWVGFNFSNFVVFRYHLYP